jgi:hypothetical protein
VAKPSPSAAERVRTLVERTEWQVPVWPLFVLLALVLTLIGGSIEIWERMPVDARDSWRLGLFASAGALGGVLRSLGYLLGFNSFTGRERGQWMTEAVIGPVLGAVAGMVAFLIVRASLVESGAQINRAGQYLLSLAFGVFALGAVGKIVERGLFRSSLSRSGILGGETSTAVPLLDRIERMLEQRVADLTVVNYDGYAVVEARRATEESWRLDVRFDPEKPHEGGPEISTARLNIVGGVERDFVPFTLSVVSDQYAVVPLILTASAPRHRSSEASTILLQGLPHSERGGAPRPRVRESVILEIGQGTQTIQVMPVELHDLAPQGTARAARLPT